MSKTKDKQETKPKSGQQPRQSLVQSQAEHLYRSYLKVVTGFSDGHTNRLQVQQSLQEMLKQIKETVIDSGLWPMNQVEMTFEEIRTQANSAISAHNAAGTLVWQTLGNVNVK